MKRVCLWPLLPLFLLQPRACAGQYAQVVAAINTTDGWWDYSLFYDLFPPPLLVLEPAVRIVGGDEAMQVFLIEQGNSTDLPAASPASGGASTVVIASACGSAGALVVLAAFAYMRIRRRSAQLQARPPAKPIIRETLIIYQAVHAEMLARSRADCPKKTDVEQGAARPQPVCDGQEPHLL